MKTNSRKTISYIIAAVVSLCCVCLALAALVANMPASQASIPPTIDLSTIIAATWSASTTQTAAVIPPTDTSIPTIALPTETPTFILLPTMTLLPSSGISITPSASCVPSGIAQTGKVVHVTDGDTIKVTLDQDGQTYTVRYIGIDTPENTITLEYFGPESTVKNSELVSGKQVTLFKDTSETDRYGRILAQSPPPRLKTATTLFSIPSILCVKQSPPWGHLDIRTGSVLTW